MLTEGCGFSCVSCRQGESTVSVLVVFVISSSDFRTWTVVVDSFPLLSQAPTHVEVELGCDNIVS